MDLAEYTIELVFPEGEKAEILKAMQRCYIRCVLNQMEEGINQDDCSCLLAELCREVVRVPDLL